MSKDKKLNNLLGMKDFSETELEQKRKATKRTDVAKDILQENTGKNVFTEKPKTKEEVAKKGLNNLISLDQFSEGEVLKDAKKTKRTDVAKDVLREQYARPVLQEKKKAKEECEKEKCDDKPKKKDSECITKKQAKLPWNKGKKICK
jgi:uncharacterized membrane protein